MSATPNQMGIMINFMEDHTELAKNYSQKSVQGRQAINKMWDDLINQLNAQGPPIKSVTSWRKVWTDFKYRSKKKVSNNLISLKKTGGGPSDQVPLTELEEKVVQIASLRDAVAGSTATLFGAPASKNMEEFEEVEYIMEDMELEQPSQVENIIEDPKPNISTRNADSSLYGNPPKKVKSCNKDKLDTAQILKSQVEMDSKFQSNVLALLEQRNKQEAAFHAEVIDLLAKRNEIALIYVIPI